MENKSKKFHLKRPKVIAIDDNWKNLISIQALLKNTDCDVITAESGQQAIDYLTKNTSDIALILLDARMPIMDGYQTAEFIRDTFPEKFPLIFLTASDGDLNSIKKAYEVGAIDFIFKPIDPEILLAKVNVFLDLHKTRQLEVFEQRTEEALEELYDLFMQAPVAMVVLTGPEYLFTFANPPYIRFVGRDVVGKKLLDVFTKEEVGYFIPIMDQVYKTGKPYIGREMPLNIPNQEGITENRFIDVEYNPFKDANGTIKGIFALIQDVTDKVKARRAIEEAKLVVDQERKNFRNLFKQIPELVCILRGPDHVFDFVNEAHVRILGFDATGMTVREAQPESMELYGILNDVYRTGKPADLHEIPITVGDRVRYFNLTYAPRRDSAGKINGVMILGSEVTERVLLLKEISDNSRRSEFLSNASKVLNFSLDVEATLVELSRISVPAIADWCSIQLLTPEGTLKQVAVMHKDPDKIKQVSEFQKKYPASPESPSGAYGVIRNGKSVFVPEITQDLLHKFAKDEEHRKMLLSLDFKSFLCVPIRTREKIIGTLTLVTTTESNRTYTQADVVLAEDLGFRSGLAIDNARLYIESQKINQVKDEFLATLSHELRTPMNVILGHTEILRNEWDQLSKVDIRKSLETIHRNATAQTGLIADLLNVSTIISGKFTYEPKKISSVATVNTVVESFAPVAKAKDIKLVCDTSNAPKEVVADPTRLHQIVWNLISNAIKFTERGGLINVVVRGNHRMWNLEVSDTGKGIDPRFMPHIFDRFRQEDSTTTRKFGGLGLGLSIVKHLVEIHGGKVQAYSDGKGKGGKFIVTFPLQPAAVSDSAPSTAQQNLADVLRDIKILLVEDSYDTDI